MAEAWLNHLCGDSFEAQSAGLEPGKLNPLAVEVMNEAGIDISQKKTQSVFDVFKSGQLFAYVITVCDESSAEKCPIFPGPAQRLHWSFPDPSRVTGTLEEKLTQVRKIRDQIRTKIENWCAEVRANSRSSVTSGTLPSALAVALALFIPGCSWFAPVEMHKAESGRTTFRSAESPSETATPTPQKLPGEQR